MNKRGQFFLIAALLISGIAIGFSTLYNSAYIERADTQVYDLSEELYAELQQTYDAGMVRGETQEDIQANLKKLADYYQLQNPDSTFVIFYGTGEKVERLDTSLDASGSELVSDFTTDTSSASQSSTSTRSTQSEVTPTSSGNIAKKNKVKIRVKLKDKTPQTEPSTPQKERILESPSFELKHGQNFYFVIRKKVKNEQVVVYR